MNNLNLGKLLARDIVRHNNKVDELVKNKTYKFSVWVEGDKAFVQTAFCNVGGCVAGYVTFDCLAKAERHSAIMTISGEELQKVGICSECLNDGEDDIYCGICGREKMPVYDQFPNWLKFCTKCDKYVD